MEEERFVTVTRPVDPVHQSLIESTLQQTGILYRTRNVEVQDLFGLGQIGGYNIALGAIEVQVDSTRLEEARQALADLDGEGAAAAMPAELTEDPEDPETEIEKEAEHTARRYANSSLICAVLWLGGIGSLLAIYFGVRALGLEGRKPTMVLVKAIVGLVLGSLEVIILLWLAGLQIPGT